MQSFNANDAKTQIGQLANLAPHGPLDGMRQGTAVGVGVSAQDYGAMRVFYANRLAHTFDQTALEAERAGLDDAKLAELFADES